MLTELASGVDTLYVSARCDIPASRFEELDQARELARQRSTAERFVFGGYDCELKLGSLNKHRYRLDHPVARVGISPSDSLPALFVQFQSESIHSVGATGVLRWLDSVLANEGLDAQIQASRIDLHADWQGWNLIGDQRHRFVCRARSRVTYEDGDDLTGFGFGNLNSKSIIARIYDKTEEMRKTGKDWLPALWGTAYEPDAGPVLRTEFQFDRNALRESGINTPDEAIANIGGLWAYATQEWLTYRQPSRHECTFRWPIAPEWQQVQRATLGGSTVPIQRIKDGNIAGSLRRITPAMNGYLASFGALTGHDDIEAVCDAAKIHLRAYEQRSRRSFCDRVHERRRKLP